MISISAPEGKAVAASSPDVDPDLLPDPVRSATVSSRTTTQRQASRFVYRPELCEAHPPQEDQFRIRPQSPNSKAPRLRSTKTNYGDNGTPASSRQQRTSAPALGLQELYYGLVSRTKQPGLLRRQIQEGFRSCAELRRDWEEWKKQFEVPERKKGVRLATASKGGAGPRRSRTQEGGSVGDRLCGGGAIVNR